MGGRAEVSRCWGQTRSQSPPPRTGMSCLSAEQDGRTGAERPPRHPLDWVSLCVSAGQGPEHSARRRWQQCSLECGHLGRRDTSQSWSLCRQHLANGQQPLHPICRGPARASLPPTLRAPGNSPHTWVASCFLLAWFSANTTIVSLTKACAVGITLPISQTENLRLQQVGQLSPASK